MICNDSSVLTRKTLQRRLGPAPSQPRSCIRGNDCKGLTPATTCAIWKQNSQPWWGLQAKLNTAISIFSHFDWICCNRTQGVCLCVCMCVCLCVCLSSLQPKRMDRFWWNFPTLSRIAICQWLFLGFPKLEVDYVMTANLHFCVSALSRSQFCFDFLQIWTQVTLVDAGIFHGI